MILDARHIPQDAVISCDLCIVGAGGCRRLALHWRLTAVDESTAHRGHAMLREDYVTGSSVFPTSGAANPTLTIVALALRLADHVRKVLAHPWSLVAEIAP